MLPVKSLSLLTLFVVSLLVVHAQAQYVVVGEPMDVVLDKPKAKVGVMTSDEGHKELLQRDMTNAERMQKGLAPAYPRPLSAILGSRRRKDRGRSMALHRRAPACTSGSPIAFPAHTAQQADPIVLYSGANGDTDDSTIPITLMFDVNIFGTLTPTVWVSVNGMISVNAAGGANEELYSTDVNSAAVFPFWDDLYVKGGTPNQITVSATHDSFSIRWQVTTYDDHETATGNDLDFTLFYSTTTPGRWYTYYDITSDRISSSTGSGATIGAQGAAGSNLFTQYSYDRAGAVEAGTTLAFDTMCSGSTTVG